MNTHTNTVTTYEGYWNVVLGANCSANDVVREFDLDLHADGRRGLDEWLGLAEVEAISFSRLDMEVLESWATFHERALNLLTAAVEEK
jgi:hypothetical protein